jgi:hypothetical protein
MTCGGVVYVCVWWKYVRRETYTPIVVYFDTHRFQFSPYEVMDFCKECVLSEEELCDVPETFYKEPANTKLKP